MTISIDDIHKAAALIQGQVMDTPLMAAPRLSALTGADIFVKYENLQITNSFKDRGALVRLLALTGEERKRGVIAMSAGNHAQSVAYHAARLGIPAHIVMPVTTPIVKVAATEQHGATVILEGETVGEAEAVALRMAKENGYALVHPYNDPHVIAGQGTIALEILAREPDLDCLVIPVGGGGLISGCAIAACHIKPDIEIIGVEAAAFPAMSAALSGMEPQFGGQTLAEGIAVKKVGDLCLKIARELVSRVILVQEAELERAVNAYLMLQKTMAEGAGAAGLAALLSEPGYFSGRKVGLVLTGGNIDPRILASVMMRELERTHQVASFRIMTHDRPGELGRIATLLGDAGANILEVSHNRLFLDVPAKGTNVD
ncbi:MAG: threonine ammonia-lyase, partial [Fimbriimonadaceae bacterium]|nr:threonine ammonia-lyase [Alphaproteobacteria bacterium]